MDRGKDPYRTHDPGPSRRRFLQTTLGVGVIPPVSSLNEENKGSIRTNLGSSESPGGSISHADSGGARASRDNQVASVIQLHSENVELGGTTDSYLRIQNDQDQSVNVRPEGGESIQLTNRTVIRVYNGDGSINEHPRITSRGEEYQVEVSGDLSMFQSDPIFSGYSVDLVEDGEVINSTEERVYGIGYPTTGSRETTNGEIKVSFNRVEEVEESWLVVFEIVNYDADRIAHRQVEKVMEHRDNLLVTTYDEDAVEPVPEGGFRDINILFYVDGDSTDSPNLWAILREEKVDSSPTEISDWHDLNAVREDLNGDFALMADLDSETPGYNEHIGGPTDGWDPIGDFEDPFTGSLDGNDHRITGLHIDRPETTSVGLFGHNDGTIARISLTGVDIKGGSEVGGLAGWNSRDVTESTAHGEVSGARKVGGLVGKNGGAIRESYANCEVTGQERVGGLVGGNQVGSEIIKSYARGDVTANNAVGGLFGGNQVRTRIIESYATGEVKGSASVGGLVGHVDDSKIKTSYWDVETSGQESSAGLPEVNGLSTEQMTGDTAINHLDGFDFENTWQLVTEPDDYPILQWQDNREEAARFDPTVHGFGFSNWAGDGAWQTNGREVHFVHEEISEAEIQRTVEDAWPSDRGTSLIEPFAKYVYVGLNQGVFTNGYCYGMVQAAKEYFTNPESIPIAIDSVSDVPYPAGDYEVVGDDIRYYHSTQILETDAGNSVFNTLRPGWVDIDPREELAEVQEAIDRVGGAPIGLADPRGDLYHKVLGYMYENTGEKTVVYVYEPNASADGHEQNPEGFRLEITDNPDSEMAYFRRDVKQSYTQFVSLTDLQRESNLREVVIMSIIMALIDGADFVHSIAEAGRLAFIGIRSPARIEVTSPPGTHVMRLEGQYINSDATEYSEGLLAFGAAPGEYTIDVVGEANGEYTLDLIAASREETLLSESISGQINTGEHQVVAVELGETATESQVRTDSTMLDRLPPDGVVAAAAGGSVLAMGAVYFWYRRSKASVDIVDEVTASTSTESLHEQTQILCPACGAVNEAPNEDCTSCGRSLKHD